MASLSRKFFIGGLRRRGWRMLAVLLLAWPQSGWPQSAAHEREVRAIFLLNLTRFVRWPEHDFPAEDAPLLIGVLAEDPLGDVLEDAARGESAGKHAIAIRRIDTAADLEGCHVVYFPKTHFPKAVPMMAQLRDRSVLTVSDNEGFLRLGGHVLMFNRAGQVKLRLDVGNLRRAGLIASSQLLRVAEVVGK